MNFIKKIVRINSIQRMGLCASIALALVACTDFVSVDAPTTRIVREQTFVDDASTTSTILGIYSEMNTSDFASSGFGSISLLTGLSSDELVNYLDDVDYGQFYTNSLIASNGAVRNSLWGAGYKYIYYANSILEGLETAKGVSDSVKSQIVGEAKFVRAFCYFYLVNLYGDIPIATTTDYRVNNTLSRSSVSQVYELILSDLSDASARLSEAYPEAGRIRPNVYTAKALLARVYLYLKNYEKAEDYATEVLESGLYQLEEDLGNVFLNTSQEAIWQLKPVDVLANTNEANLYVLYWSPYLVALRPALADSFDIADVRRQAWVGSVIADDVEYFYPYKYKVPSYQTPNNEYSTVFRLAELYLIRAEARANRENLAGAIGDIDEIRQRAGIDLIADVNPSIGKAELLNVIMRERLLEYFSEWGHRWFDLKRTGRAADVLPASKGITWSSTDALYPIPSLERINNTNLGQNDGY